MSILGINANTIGKPIFEGATAYRQKDNASDNMVSGAYSHLPIEFSATEANEWQSVLTYIANVIKAGGGALAVRNTTGGPLPAGPVTVTGYDVANAAFLIGAANATGAAPALVLLLAALANNTNGTAYIGGTFTAAGLDTTGSAVGNPVYLAAGGGMTLTAPTAADTIQQIIGRVQTLANPGVISGLVNTPTKFGTSWHQNLSITGALIAAATIDLTTKVVNSLPIANGGTNSSTALTASAIAVSNGTQIVQGPQGTATTLLHGNAAGLPTYGAAALTTDVSGVLPVANGGTNNGTAVGAFNNLSPLTTKGDLVTRDVTNNIRLPVGVDGQVLKSDSTQASGLAWSNLQRVVQPTTITANTNNYAPGSAEVQRWIATAGGWLVTGMVAGYDGEIRHIYNGSGSFQVTLKHLSASSSAANQFFCTAAADIAFSVNSVVVAIYDGAAALWRVNKLP